MRTLAERQTNTIPQLEAAELNFSHLESTDHATFQEPSEGPAFKIQGEVSMVDGFVQQLAALGVEQSFGVSGGAIALLFDALQDSAIGLHHFRHETGAAFAATEAYFANAKPTLVFATTGPGLLNALTGITAARWDGAKVILVSGSTSAPQRGRWATQETSSYTFSQDALYSRGAIFDFAVRMEQAAELPSIVRRLRLGLSRPGRFVAHISLPMSVQSQRLDNPRLQEPMRSAVAAPCKNDIEQCVRLLKRGSFAIWAGFGATAAARQVRDLVERSGAKIFCSPRGKGIVPENHPQYLGVSGLGGHDAVNRYMVLERPDWVLVLGTRLGEPTSFWDPDLLPNQGFIHVDLDPDVPGTAYPDFETLGVQADIGHFMDALLEHFPKRLPRTISRRPYTEPIPLRIRGRSPVRPQVLMDTLQRRVIQATDAVVLAECGNAFAWCNHYLRFPTPGRYRVSTLFGSMGHAAAGVVGAALARKGKAVAVVGDGSMLMNTEISSAVQYGAQAVWIILNDAGYGMCRDGHRALGLTDSNIDFPRVDFVAYARALQADGETVTSEDELEAALAKAMAAPGPFVVDIRIDTNEPSPLLKRFESLIRQGNSKNVAGWET
jgi:acetolactate synthase-1/2/3 large subunit